LRRIGDEISDVVHVCRAFLVISFKSLDRNELVREVKPPKCAQQSRNRDIDISSIHERILQFIQVHARFLVQQSPNELYIHRVQSSMATSLKFGVGSRIVGDTVFLIVCQCVVNESLPDTQNTLYFLDRKVLDIVEVGDASFYITRYVLARH
jgi:hypothetical protein